MNKEAMNFGRGTNIELGFRQEGRASLSKWPWLRRTALKTMHSSPIAIRFFRRPSQCAPHQSWGSSLQHSKPAQRAELMAGVLYKKKLGLIRP